jgi:hypothetical protein
MACGILKFEFRDAVYFYPPDEIQAIFPRDPSPQSAERGALCKDGTHNIANIVDITTHQVKVGK